TADYNICSTNQNLKIEWVTTEGLILSELLIKEKGHQFVQALSIPEESLIFLNLWISRFKKCNGLKNVVIHSEGRSAPLETLPAERVKLQELLSCYDPEDIYNANKIGLFYRLLSNQMLSKKKRFHIQDKQVLLLVDNASSHTAPKTNNPTKIQNDTVEIDNSAKEIEEICEQPQGRS
ncbi:39902_t:CDS:2, partial [Gigaspora margarita]